MTEHSQQSPKRSWLDRVAKLGQLAAVGTLIFGVVQYTTKIETDRAQTTISLIQEWRADGYQDALACLSDQTLDLQQKARANSSKEEWDKLNNDAGMADNLRRYITQSLFEAKDQTAVCPPPGNEAAFEDLIEYFSMLGLCVESRMCSRKVTKIYFAETVVNFRSVFKLEIESRQDRLPGYALGFEILYDHIK